MVCTGSPLISQGLYESFHSPVRVCTCFPLTIQGLYEALHSPVFICTGSSTLQSRFPWVFSLTSWLIKSFSPHQSGFSRGFYSPVWVSTGVSTHQSRCARGIPVAILCLYGICNQLSRLGRSFPVTPFWFTRVFSLTSLGLYGFLHLPVQVCIMLSTHQSGFVRGFHCLWLYLGPVDVLEERVAVDVPVRAVWDAQPLGAVFIQQLRKVNETIYLRVRRYSMEDFVGWS